MLSEQSSSKEAVMETTKFRNNEETADTQSLKLESAALSRLLDEVRNNQVSAPTAYNRTHNRHNR